MPQSTQRDRPVPPQLIVSEPSVEVASISGKPNLASRRRDHRTCKEQERFTSSEWIDIDESPPRRRKHSKRSSQVPIKVSRASKNDQIREQCIENELPRFFPRLAKILEVNESIASSRQSTRGTDQRRRREGNSSIRNRVRDNVDLTSRRSVRHRTADSARRNEDFLKVNPSLLSVLSSLTGNSDRSSGSSSTVTQKSYDRRASSSSRSTNSRSRHVGGDVYSSMTSKTQEELPNVFNYMEAPIHDDGQDRQSIGSTSSASQYEPSEAGSSAAPDTPSSLSTFPSPTSARSHSGADLRKKYDSPCAPSPISVRSNSNSPDPSLRSLRKRPTICDVPEDEEEDSSRPILSRCDQPRSSSRSTIGSRRSNDRLQHQEESLRQHIAYTQQGHYVEPNHGQHRSFSNASAQSDQSAHAYHLAMQQYQWPPPSAPMAPPVVSETMNGHINPHERPPLPGLPDLSRRTLSGYEELALELTSAESPIKPLYRKFKYLNHRILLHLQDELCELEEQLRTVDEIIAQMDPALADGQKTPASRRVDAFHGSEIHLRRTHLLGHIFLKTEQYNRAMSAYASMAKDSTAADDEQLRSYQTWMTKHAPIHSIEARFLYRREDLIMPDKKSASVDRPMKQVAFAYLPLVLMLPLLLYSIIPTLAGRLVVTALIALGAFLVAASTRIRLLMSAREWVVCGAVYTLLMAAISACIPSHT